MPDTPLTPLQHILLQSPQARNGDSTEAEREEIARRDEVAQQLFQDQEGQSIGDLMPICGNRLCVCNGATAETLPWRRRLHFVEESEL
mmetsp:Transcript_7295/g.9448  ORF Transcript_7295/g.9448 Transcript_7295/m.9448 type:complete len:88 (+) Transcript_7295:180-443(+)